MTQAKPKVLRIGKWSRQDPKWTELSNIADIVECESQCRDEFFSDLRRKYSDVTSIVRTYHSIQYTGRFDGELALHLPASVKSISHNGAGYDQIDVQPFTERNIQVSNVTTPVEAPTALTAVYLTLAAMRNFQQGHEFLVQEKWPKTQAAGAEIGMDPEGKTLGIFGMGGIGRAIRDRLVPFGFDKIIYHNRTRLSADLEKDSVYASSDDLLRTSDVIMLSVPLNAKTRHMVNSELISKMKKGVIIINTARGAVIDEKAMIDALKLGHVGALGADVFENEPNASPDLYGLPNVVSLPHMGTYTKQAVLNMERFVVENVRTYLTTGKMLTNVPEQYGIDFGHEALCGA